jgi:acyl-CoA thioester hydrolase
MQSKVFHLPVQIYYEDTDHSGVVYHANYLKYFERSREHVIGKDLLVRLWRDRNIGFAVYKADITYSEGAEFGDILDIRSSYRIEGNYRIIWTHEAWKENRSKPAVSCELHLVCMDREKKLVPVPFEHLGELNLQSE